MDAVLGPPAVSWEGAAQASERDRASRAAGMRRARSGTCCCPALHAVQSRVGLDQPRARSTTSARG